MLQWVHLTSSAKALTARNSQQIAANPIPNGEPTPIKLYGFGAEYHKLNPSKAIKLPPR